MYPEYRIILIPNIINPMNAIGVEVSNKPKYGNSNFFRNAYLLNAILNIGLERKNPIYSKLLIIVYIKLSFYLLLLLFYSVKTAF